MYLNIEMKQLINKILCHPHKMYSIDIFQLLFLLNIIVMITPYIVENNSRI